jgi:putative addiction module component (TIGR02574 family)
VVIDRFTASGCEATDADIEYTPRVSSSAKKLLEEALHLDESERASLAGALIESLHGPADMGVDEAWEQLIERRLRDFAAGSAETIPWSEVRARLFSGFE